MDIISLAERLGEAPLAALFGMITGIIFGVAAQRSRFCMRAATVQFARGEWGDRMAVWLLCFSTALIWVQAGKLAGVINVNEARMMAVPGSWSGAVIGGLLFGVGMVLSRGCSGRLLVLASTGNLRSLVSGLVFAVVAQMSLSGVLAPWRDKLAALWVTEGGRNMNLLTALRLPDWFGLALGVAIAAIAFWLSARNRISWSTLVFASGVGFAVAVGWGLTSELASVAFEPVQIESATFSGPSAHTLMYFLDRNALLEFDVGLVPGVVIGAFAASFLSREFTWQSFEDAATMQRSMLGAAFMGFGAMLAGGCAIGAGVTGGSIFAGTAWVALTCMWIGAAITDRLVDQRGARLATV